jgi:ORF6N domain
MSKKPSIQNSSFSSVEAVEGKILLIRGHRVMLDVDLAEVYQVTTKRLNEQVKRNRRRFPEDLCFSFQRMRHGS